MPQTARSISSHKAVNSSALLTDTYELTMLQSALHDGSAHKPVTFEMFARKLPPGRRFGIVAGTQRFLEELSHFRFSSEHLAQLERFLNPQTIAYLRDFSFNGDIDGYQEGELYFPGSPILTVKGTFAQACIIETLALSIFNHDCAVASAGARMALSARKRITIEMGSRRTHERAAVAAARAAYISGISATSNLQASQIYGIPHAGTAGHAFTLLHNSTQGADEKAAFRAQVEALGTHTTLLVDTYDISQGIANAIEVAGPQLGAVRIDSGDLGVLASQVRAQLDSLGAKNTKIVVSGDLDEFSMAALQAYPIDIYGVGTSLVVGSGAPTAGLVYKLVEVDGTPVSKRAPNKRSKGGIKASYRIHRTTGTLIDECYQIIPEGLPSQYPLNAPHLEEKQNWYRVNVPLVRQGKSVYSASINDSRTLVADRLRTLPWEALSLSSGEPAFHAYEQYP